MRNVCILPVLFLIQYFVGYISHSQVKVSIIILDKIYLLSYAFFLFVLIYLPDSTRWKRHKEPGRHAKIPIRRQNRNEIIFTKEILYIYKIWVDPRDSHDQ